MLVPCIMCCFRRASYQFPVGLNYQICCGLTSMKSVAVSWFWTSPMKLYLDQTADCELTSELAAWLDDAKMERSGGWMTTMVFGRSCCTVYSIKALFPTITNNDCNRW